MSEEDDRAAYYAAMAEEDAYRQQQEEYDRWHEQDEAHWATINRWLGDQS